MIKTNYYQDLTKMNTFGMTVKSRYFVEYDSVSDLVDIEFEELPQPVLHIGGGSNLLFTEDFKGTVLHSKINFIEILESDQSSVRVSVGAGVVFDDFCKWASEQSLWGVENLSHIPGEVGASAVQNIGAYGVEVKDVIETVYCYDIREERFVHFTEDECGYGYRESNFKTVWKGHYIVTHVVFRLTRSYSPRLDYGHLAAKFSDLSALTPAMVRKTVIDVRKDKLPEPSVMGSAGSFFKNPVITPEHFSEICRWAEQKYGPEYKVPSYHIDTPEGQMVKVPAAWMIEQCGWKGRRSGGAAVYDKQPLVIVNYTGQAYPEEIIGLERKIINSVKDTFRVELHPEVEHI